MGFCHSSMASKERYEYYIAVVNRELAIIENMRVDGVDHQTSDDVLKNLPTSSANLI